jgi:hypothetical protein
MNAGADGEKSEHFEVELQRRERTDGSFQDTKEESKYK